MNNDLHGKKITVAGATGFIGTNLVESLVLEGAKVRALTHNKPPQIINSQVEYVNVDLMRLDDCKAVTADTDIFVMAAANSSGAAVMSKNPLTHLAPNVVMNALTLESCLLSGVKKYCFISSSTVYPSSENPVSENDVTGEFFENYKVVGDMKLFSERMVKNYCMYSKGVMDGVILRPSNLYGPFDKFSKEESKVIPALIRRAVERENPFVVWGDGVDVKDFLYVTDFVRALIQSLKSKDPFTILNVAYGESVVLKNVVEEILMAANSSDLTIKFDKSKPTMIPKRLISNELAIKKLSWQPQNSLSSGLELTVNWYKENLHLESQL